MNRITRHGLFGFALAIVVSTANTAPAQAPLPELFGPPPRSVDTGLIGTDAEELGASKTARVAADSAIVKPVDAFEINAERRLVDSVPSSSDLATRESEATKGKPTAKELRQARALYRQRQRLERLERNLWAGYEPLRPNWNSIPMMSSRYPTRNTVVVPVYIYPW